MSERPPSDRERWNARYQEQGGIPEPSPFVLSLAPILPRRGQALDLAGGSGRHALWLARRGLDVTLLDGSEVALERAAAAARAEGLGLRTVQQDLLASPPPPGPWAVVICTYFLHRPLFALLPGLLGPGGILAFAHSTRTNLTRHPRPGPDHLLDDGELARVAAGLGLELLHLSEGWSEADRHEARLVARKPA